MESWRNDEPPEEEDDDKDRAAHIADDGWGDMREDMTTEERACADAEIEDSRVDGEGNGRAFGWGDAHDLRLEGYVEVGCCDAPEGTNRKDDDWESAEGCQECQTGCHTCDADGDEAVRIATVEL